MKTKAFWAGLAVLALSACGPMIGGMMVASSGVKEFKVVQGSLADLRAGARVAVLGPFDKTAEAFYICRGEEAAQFASEFNRTGLFEAELAIDTRFPEERPQARTYAGRHPAQVQQALSLDNTPELVMSGTILSREMVAAPANGVIMTATYRLEFQDLASTRTIVVEVTTKELFQGVIPATVAELATRMNGF